MTHCSMSGSTTSSKVSVILPTYNGRRFIARAIESVLRQEYRDFELLVIDDGSTDDVASKVAAYVARDARVRLIRNGSNLGLQKTLNVGLREAQGEYIARIDDDDVWELPHKLAQQVRFLDKHPDYALVGTGVIVVDEHGTELFRFLNPETDHQLRRRMLYRNYFSHASVMFRKSIAMQFGGYSERVEALHVEDYELWLKLGTTAKLANLPIYGLRFMLRPSTISARHKRVQLVRQFQLMQAFKSSYPGYLPARIKSTLRLAAYSLFYWLLTERVRRFVLKLYKR